MYEYLKRAPFYELISRDSNGNINFSETLTLSPQICSVILLVVFPSFLEHLVYATFLKCTLLAFSFWSTGSLKSTDSQTVLVILK
jgi:hypothetical protein